MLKTSTDACRPEPIIFVHIPKTAGMSFNGILERNFGRSKILSKYRRRGLSLEEIESLEGGRLDSYDVIRGHVEFGVHRMLSRDAKYISFLRHPLKLVISFKNYGWRKREERSKLTLAEFLERRPDNVQTRFIAGFDGDVVTEEVYERALANIEERFALVGVTEMFDESVLLMKEFLNLSDVRYLRRNVNKNKKHSISEEESSLTSKYLAYDLRLWEHAKDRLNSLIDEREPEFSEELAKLKAYTQQASKLSHTTDKLAHDWSRFSEYIRYSALKSDLWAHRH